MLSSEGTYYAEPTRWGWLNFYYDETQGYYPLVGDVNADGMVDVIDAMQVVQYMLNDRCSGDWDAQCWAADCNGDGHLDARLGMELLDLGHDLLQPPLEFV